jgi:hypothetical protein
MIVSSKKLIIWKEMAMVILRDLKKFMKYCGQYGV